MHGCQLHVLVMMRRTLQALLWIKNESRLAFSIYKLCT